jgi:hypothetical protein
MMGASMLVDWGIFNASGIFIEDYLSKNIGLESAKKMTFGMHYQ